MGIKFISIGHRCHIGLMLKLYGYRTDAMPFDSIIYSFEGVIDCFENNFINFFPKKIICEYVDNRKLFRGKYGAFPHHDLDNNNIIETFKRRIDRLNDYLSSTNDEIIFCRTVIDDDEIELLNKFINTIKNKYPKLKFKILLIYDNEYIQEIILNYNEYAYILNSCNISKDQNNKINSINYKYLFDYLKNINNFDDFKCDLKFNEMNIIFKNNGYKGFAIKNGIFPYNKDN